MEVRYIQLMVKFLNTFFQKELRLFQNEILHYCKPDELILIHLVYLCISNHLRGKKSLCPQKIRRIFRLHYDLDGKNL